MPTKCVTVCVLSSSAFTIIARCVKRGCASQTRTAGSVTHVQVQGDPASHALLKEYFTQCGSSSDGEELLVDP